MAAKMHRYVAAAAVCLVLGAGAAGCGQVTASQRANHSRSSAQLTLASAPTEIYYVPSKVKHQDGTLYQHRTGTAAAADVRVGLADDPLVVPATAPGRSVTAHLQFYSSHMAMEAMKTSSAVTAATEAVSSPDAPLTSLDIGSFTYVQAGQSVIAMSAGRVVRSYPLPVLHLDHSAGNLPKGYKGLFLGTGVGEVTALVPAASGHVLAFTATGFAAAVTDLTTGHTVLLKGYGSLGSAVRTSNGQLLVLAWRANEKSFPMRVLRLNGSSYRVVSALNTALRPVNYLQDQMIIGAGPDAVVSVARGTQQAGVTRVTMNLFSVSGGHLAAGPRLPVNIGLTTALAGKGSLYVFGGPAKNKVSILNLAAGSLQRDVTTMRTKAGSYVVGIIGG